MFGERAFSHAGLTAWNSLPHGLTAAPTLNSFKRQLNTHLLILLLVVSISVLLSDDVIHRCSDFHVNCTLQIFYDDDDDDDTLLLLRLLLQLLLIRDIVCAV